MALLAIEGFDDGLAALRWPNDPGAVSATYGKNGKGMLTGDASSGQLHMPTLGITSDDTITMGGWIYINDDGGGTDENYLLGFVSGGDSMIFNYEVLIRRDTTLNRWVVRDRTGYTYGATGGCQLNTWYYVELQNTYGNSPNGSWDLHVDGVSTLSATGRDTLNTTSQRAVIWGGTETADVDVMYIDDVYLLDSTGTTNNDFLGICKVETDLPDGNGNSSDLVGSDGNSTDNYLLVDNNTSVPPATTEYVGSGTQGDKDTYTMSNLDGTVSVYGVQAVLYAVKTATGAKFVRPIVRSNSVDYAGDSTALADGTHIVADHIWETDPDTSSAWTYTAVNAAEIGAEVRDS